MSEPLANGHYYDSGWNKYFIVRGNEVSIYSAVVDPRRGTVSSERQLVMRVNADTGNVHWMHGQDRNDARELAQRFVATVRQADFINNQSTTQDFYSYVNFSSAQRLEILGYQDILMGITGNPDRPAPTNSRIEAVNPEQSVSASFETRFEGNHYLSVNRYSLMHIALADGSDLPVPFNMPQLRVAATPIPGSAREPAGLNYEGSSSVGTITDQNFLREAVTQMRAILSDNQISEAEATQINTLNERGRSLSRPY